MSRLHAELQRLYGAAPPPASAAVDTAASPAPDSPAGTPPGPSAEAPASGLVHGGQGHAAVRAAVLSLDRSAGWEPLAALWQGVQTALGLPAPAIAVSGGDALQLWFGFAEPLAQARAHQGLQALQRRWLAEVPPHRVQLWPPTPDQPPPPLPAVPAEMPDGERWSAFVSPDLAPVFADSPWLEVPPGADGQAALLAGLQPIAGRVLAAWPADEGGTAATGGLTAPTLAEPQGTPVPAGVSTGVPGVVPVVPGGAPGVAPDAVQAPAGAGAAALADLAVGETDPRRFLQAVMGCAQAPLALRIEAARALLSAR